MASERSYHVHAGMILDRANPPALDQLLPEGGDRMHIPSHRHQGSIKRFLKMRPRIFISKSVSSFVRSPVGMEGKPPKVGEKKSFRR